MTLSFTCYYSLILLHYLRTLLRSYILGLRGALSGNQSLSYSLGQAFITLNTTHNPNTFHLHKTIRVNAIMATPSQTLEEKFEEMLRLHAEKDAQIEYLRKQLAQSMRNNWRGIQSSLLIVSLKSQEKRSRKNRLVTLVKMRGGLEGLGMQDYQTWISR